MTTANPIGIDYIKKYYNVMGKTALFFEPHLSSVFSLIFPGKNTVLISDNKFLCGIAKIRRLAHIHYAMAEEKAIRFFALQDAFLLLAEKGVPVYFYNRIGKEKNGYEYRSLECKRMKEGLSFPLMYQNVSKYEDQLKDIFGELYSKEYVEAIGKIPQVIKIGRMYQHEDCSSDLINVENGKRITLYQPKTYTRTIHVYGRCGVFGYAAEDRDTIPSLLQKELLHQGVENIRVVNHGLWGGVDECIDHNFLQDVIGMKKGDIVIFYRKHFNIKLLHTFEERGVWYKDITDEWHLKRDDKVTFFDRPGHMNADGYKLVAKLICNDLLAKRFECGKVSPDIKHGTADHLNYYLKSQNNDDFEKEIGQYISCINRDNLLTEQMVNNGAIVMNCNPFTKGHRYLIETASKQVDRLYIFVVEEDKSFFLFKDRFEMVVKGTEDIENVVVVPSGKFIISSYTFPEYFMKDYVKEKNFDVSMDVETFCRYIAPPLNIKIRFAGEEPFDPVTKNYNENMARILPEHGMKFVEIPRYAIDRKRVINATRVRELLENREFDELKEYVPYSTFEILMKNYTK